MNDRQTYRIRGGAMKISKRKGVNPRHPVLPQVDVYASVMSNVLSHYKPKNAGDIKNSKAVLHAINNALFEHYRKRLKPVPQEESREAKQQQNDSVSRLRTLFVLNVNKISKLELVSPDYPPTDAPTEPGNFE